jgi:predicted esterase YcpF (UPF0227 family)
VWPALILFIHGFGSCGWGEKSLCLRRHFGLGQVLAPDLPFHPMSAIAHLQDLLDRYPVSVLVGSSLGGFYATWLNAARPLPTVLINPVVRPHELLAGYLGAQQRWCDGAVFHVGTDYLEALVALQRDNLASDERYLVLLQQGDETLDYRQAAAYYRGKEVVELPGGSHRFNHIEQQLPRIRDWLNQHSEDHAQATKTTA